MDYLGPHILIACTLICALSGTAQYSGNVLNTYELFRKDTNILESGTFTTDNYRMYWTNAPIDPHTIALERIHTR